MRIRATHTGCGDRITGHAHQPSRFDSSVRNPFGQTLSVRAGDIDHTRSTDLGGKEAGLGLKVVIHVVVVVEVILGEIRKDRYGDGRSGDSLLVERMR